MATEKHLSLTHDFCCPRCEGPHFGSARKNGVITYHCHGLEVPRHGLEVPVYRYGHPPRGWPGCGWSGPAKDCFTVPKILKRSR